ncbi:MAG TPA: PDZ domain-containing protein [Gemmatimonadales bacterium]
MKRKWITAALVVLASVPTLAGAQERPRRPGRVEVGPRAFAFTLNRGRIGVVVETDENADADKVGARIEAVSPGGPAETAGLKADDIITRFNGVSLAKNDDEDTNPGMKLVRLAQALDPGDSVRIEYRRGTENRSATLVAAEVENRWDVTAEPRIRIAPDFDFNYDGPWGMIMGHPWANLELVSLNADLGEYFGTQEGLLVVRAGDGDGDGPSLKSGDVILTIDGRKPSSPASAMRILRSYDEGESVKIDVMRKQKRVTVTWTVPDREERVRRARRRSPESET